MSISFCSKPESESQKQFFKNKNKVEIIMKTDFHFLKKCTIFDFEKGNYLILSTVQNSKEKEIC